MQMTEHERKNWHYSPLISSNDYSRAIFPIEESIIESF